MEAFNAISTSPPISVGSASTNAESDAYGSNGVLVKADEAVRMNLDTAFLVLEAETTSEGGEKGSEASQYYEGEWIDGERSGFGTMRWYDGRVYEGRWLHGKPHLNGMLEYREEHQYCN